MELSEDNVLINKLVLLVDKTKDQVVTYANSSLTTLFWQIGHTISVDILNNRRAEYGKQIVVTVSRELTERFGRNYEVKNLRRMIQFAELYLEFENVVTLSRQFYTLFLLLFQSFQQFNFCQLSFQFL